MQIVLPAGNWVSSGEYRKILGISRQALEYRRKNGKTRHISMGSTYMYDLDFVPVIDNRGNKKRL